MTDEPITLNDVEIDAEADRLFEEFCKQRAKGPDAPTIELMMTDDDPPMIIRCSYNVQQLLRYSQDLKDLVTYDEFEMKVVMERQPPWVEGKGFERRVWLDHDTTQLQMYLHRKHGLPLGPRALHDVAVSHARYDHCVHPLRDRLNSLEWDGTERLASFLIEHYGVEETAYVRAVTQKWFIAAVARVMKPGCQVDNLLVLVGDQGLRKSRGFDALSYGYFSDRLSNFGNKDSAQELQGIWLFEISEVAQIKKSESEDTKAFLSRRVDKFRPPYGRIVEEFPRQCVFFGTTNNDEFLKDTTGNRRFWPVKVTKRAKTEAIEEVRDQLWAEAVARFKSGERWWIDEDEEAEVYRIAVAVQDEHRVTSILTEPVLDRANYLASRLYHDGRQPVAGVSDILGLMGITNAQRRQHQLEEVADILKRQGWERKKTNRGARWTPPAGWEPKPAGEVRELGEFYRPVEGE